jgi:hypothetical protein
MKVAICLSGETRIFNRYVQKFNNLISQSKQEGITVDLYGHTWDHCDIDFETGLLKQLKIENQKVIDDWVKEDFIKRTYYDPADLIPVDKDFISLNIDRSRKVYGQMFSGITSLQMPDDSYDLYIRARWDTIPMSSNFDPIFFKMLTTKQELARIYTLENYAHAQDNRIHFKINDTVFGINKPAWSLLMTDTWEVVLDKIISNQILANTRIRDHALWTAYISNYPISIYQNKFATFKLLRE